MNVDPVAPIAGAFCLIVGGILAVALIVLFFYLRTLQSALSRVSPEHRLMEPGQVWLMLVPCWNIIWQFVVAVRVPESLRAEFVARGRDDGSDYGKGIALASCILGLVGGACGRGLQMSDPAGQDVGAMISGVVGIVNLILFIVFWSKIASYSRQLAFDDDNRKRKWEQFDDDDDDYGRTPPKDDPPPDGIKEGDAGRYS